MEAKTGSPRTRYPPESYSPRRRPEEIPLWYRDESKRKAWGMLMLLAIAVYFTSSVSIVLFRGADGAAICLLLIASLLGAYLNWQGWKLVRHG